MRPSQSKICTPSAGSIVGRRVQASAALRLDREGLIVNLQSYELRIRGLKEAPGKIKAAAFMRTLDALTKTAERATRLLATGAGTGRGSQPKWLSAATGFTISGFRPGSTICDIEAPSLRETASQAFGQPGFWDAELSMDDTALDLAARAISEAQSENSSGDYFDRSVLEAIGSFGRAVRGKQVRYELIPHSRAHEEFELDIQSCARIRARLKALPEPRAFVVSGRLDEIKHGNGRFSLLINERSRLFGRLDPESLNVESLRPIWGKQTTVEGIVHFKANGQSRLIEARRISGRAEGDSVFEEVPSVARQDLRDLFPHHERKIQSFDPIELAGIWPGDEPLEDLMAQLD